MANLQNARKILIPLVIVGLVGTIGLMVASLSAGVRMGADWGDGKSGFKQTIKRVFKGIRSIEKTKQESKTLEAKGLSELVVKGDALGAVTVHPGTGEVIKVVATVHGFGGDENEAREMLATL